MEAKDALAILTALSHETRLGAFRLLVRQGFDGMPAGEIARQLGVRPNTLSNQLTILTHVGLVHARRDGRSIIYTADYDIMQGFMQFMIEDCCNGNPSICAPLTRVLETCSACADQSTQTKVAWGTR